MKLFIEYPSCSTCQKARKWLDGHHLSYQDRHIRENPPTVEELREWYGKSGLELRRFFNTSGRLYASLNLKEKLSHMTEEEQLILLASDGMLIRRPLVIDGDVVLVGFKEKEWETRLL